MFFRDPRNPAALGTSESDIPRIRELFAARNAPWIEHEGGILVALVKRRPPVLRWLARAMKSPTAVTVRLEDTGARVWGFADGAHTLADIARSLAGEDADGPRVDEEAARVQSFTSVLAKNKLLSLYRRAVRTAYPDPGFPDSFREIACPKCEKSTFLSGPRGIRYVCPKCRRVVREPAP